jgi:hypothetical protein
MATEVIMGSVNKKKEEEERKEWTRLHGRKQTMTVWVYTLFLLTWLVLAAYIPDPLSNLAAWVNSSGMAAKIGGVHIFFYVLIVIGVILVSLVIAFFIIGMDLLEKIAGKWVGENHPFLLLLQYLLVWLIVIFLMGDIFVPGFINGFRGVLPH